MVAHVMALPPGDGGFRSGGLPIRLLAQDAIRRARSILTQRDAAATAPQPPTPPAGDLPSSSVAETTAAVPVAMLPDAGPAVLAQALRGFSILDLYVEAKRAAMAAAAEFEHLEGLAAGRTYGDRSLAGLITPDSYRLAAAEAKRRAEMAGATADFLRGMLGHESALGTMLDDPKRAG